MTDRPQSTKPKPFKTGKALADDILKSARKAARKEAKESQRVAKPKGPTNG
jgi:hypothetical protein